MTNPAIRVVGRRRYRETDAIDPNVTVDFDEDGIFVTETTEISADDGASMAAAVLARRGVASALVDALSPSAYAIHLALTAALEPHSAAVEARLSGDPPHLLIAVKLPSHDWYDPTGRAFAAVVALLVADRVSIPPTTTSAVVEHDRHLGRYVVPIDTVLRNAKRGHVVACYAEDAQLPAGLRPFCDVVIDLTAIDPDFFDRAIEREFDGNGVAGWSDDIRLAEIDPDLLDSVCDRASTAPDAVRMLRDILDARSVSKRVADAKAAAEKPATTTSAKTVHTAATTRPTAPTLVDLHGFGAAKAWGHQLSEDVGLYAAGQLGWSDVDAGCLLYGPPGTGKTLFASALAATCGLPFIAASYAQWQASGDGHLGYVVKAIRSTFETANQNAPCILFIDEIDAVLGRGGRGDSDGWWSAVVTALLECLDGTSRRQGVIVVAACNHPEVLDPAMVRSGRLDRRFEIGLPDEGALLGIMRHHLPEADTELLQPAATALAGSTSGADVARIAREARRVARRENRPVAAADLLAIALPFDDRPEDLRRLVAVHEAGHAVVGMLFGHVPRCLSTVGVGGGRTAFTMGASADRPSEIAQRVCMALAGRAAEEVVLGQASGGAGGASGSDLDVATSLLANADARQGLGGSLAYVGEPDGAAVEHRLRRLYAETVLLVVRHRAAVERLADLALERRVLGQAALQEFAVEHGLGGRR